MSDTYDFRIELKEPIDITDAIGHFLDKGFEYIGYLYDEAIKPHKISLEEAISRMNEKHGLINLRTGQIEFGFHYEKKFMKIVLMFEFFMLEREGVKELLQGFARYMRENYPVKEIREDSGYKHEPYPFALKDDK
ncbi:MAG: hypothetical protein KJ709_05300 [Nanoarchaeota archaeon]|nr:hypothetical protein [Nanoarchaeota archaeon]